MGYQPLPPEPTRQEQIEWPAAFLLNRPLNPKLKMEVPNSLGFYKSSHPLLDRPRNPRLSSTIRKSRPGILAKLFRKREKAQPKQEHVSLFEALEDGPYVGCIECDAWQEIVPKVNVEVFYERGGKHTHFLSALYKYPPADRVYISKCIGDWSDGKPVGKYGKVY